MRTFSGTGSIGKALGDLLPGLLLCIAISAIAVGAEALEKLIFDHSYIEALVIAILVGMAIRVFWEPGSRWQSGIAFSAKQVLEVAVVALGASLSLQAILRIGPLVFLTVAATVVVTLAFSFAVARLLGLSPRLATLIACGNAICGNSAIAAVAPVIGANKDEIAASISLTALLGVLVVLGLPLLIPVLQLSATQYGFLAGLTVYAVPQVLAATMPAGLVSTQLGTLVKLVRVLMLGPVIIGVSIIWRRMGENENHAGGFVKFVPWFIIGFAVMGALRSVDLIPAFAVAPIASLTKGLTIVSMAALGLGVDTRVLVKVGGRVAAAVSLSLLFLLVLSVTLVQLVRV